MLDVWWNELNWAGLGLWFGLGAELCWAGKLF